MFFAAARAASEPIHHCLDWFGASQAVARQWLKAGYSAVSFDIKLNHEHDMVSESGCKNLLTIAAQSLASTELEFLSLCRCFVFW